MAGLRCLHRMIISSVLEEVGQGVGEMGVARRRGGKSKRPTEK